MRFQFILRFLIDCLYNWFGNGSKENKLTEQAHAFTGGVIATKRKAFLTRQKQEHSIVEDAEASEENGSYTKKRHAMLDTLLMAELNKKIDGAGIQEEVDTFVFEGFDTTMTAITFILFAIANHEDVQQKLYDEIKAHEGDLNYNDLTYMDAVIKEALRLYPPVPFIGRILGEDTVIGKYILAQNIEYKNKMTLIAYHHGFIYNTALSTGITRFAQIMSSCQPKRSFTYS